MRARSIKPGICDNEILGTADPFYTLLFERLWMMADREGRLEDRPLRIKAQAFPYRDGLDVEPMLAWLHTHGFIQRYSHDGCRFIQVLKFVEHQSPHIKEAASKIPAPDKPGASPVQAPDEEQPKPALAALTPSSLTPDSGLLTPDSGQRITDAPDAPRVLADRKITPEGAMAIALRDLGVTVRSIDPVLQDWIRDGYTVQQATDAVGIARIRKPHPEPIPPNYLNTILRAPQRAPPKIVDRVTWRPPPDEEPAGVSERL
jgi:hypothetical protein